MQPVPIYSGHIEGFSDKWDHELDPELGYQIEVPRIFSLAPASEEELEGDRCFVGSYFALLRLEVTVEGYGDPEDIEKWGTPSFSLLAVEGEEFDYHALDVNGRFAVTLLGQAGKYGELITPQLIVRYGGPNVTLTLHGNIKYVLQSTPDSVYVNI